MEVQGLSKGRIVTRLSPRQIDNAVVYTLNPGFFDVLSDALDAQADQLRNPRTVNKVAKLVNDLLHRMAELDLETETSVKKGNQLSRAWSPFLARADTSLFKW